MNGLIWILKLAAVVFIGVGLLHLSLGPRADVLLGANLSAESISDAVLDSQNRFYGVVFSVYGFLFYLCATDMKRYEPVFWICIAVFFAGGLARLVSLGFTGVPSPPVLVLTLIELLLPPVLALWYRAVKV